MAQVRLFDTQTWWLVRGLRGRIYAFSLEVAEGRQRFLNWREGLSIFSPFLILHQRDVVLVHHQLLGRLQTEVCDIVNALDASTLQLWDWEALSRHFVTSGSGRSLLVM
jgi:hypothetical protein